MIKQFVLSYIRNNMSHETMETRSEIFQAINEGCADAFTEDNLASRISWTVGELVGNDREFRSRCGDVDTRRSVSMATMQEISKFRG
jgi:hypothetical protein